MNPFDALAVAALGAVIIGGWLTWRLRGLCHHRWVEVSRKAVPGALETDRSFEARGGLWSEQAADALYGYTLVELRCEECGEVGTRKLSGALSR